MRKLVGARSSGGGFSRLMGSSLRRSLFGGTWSIVAPARSERPQGESVSSQSAAHRSCPFCDGNESETMPEVFALRPVGSDPNGPGWSLRVVPNKYPALEPLATQVTSATAAYEEITTATGFHEVVIDTPKHEGRLSGFSVAQLETILSVYQSRVDQFGRQPHVESVVLFRNDGAAAGATQVHPHTQILALPVIPCRVQRELEAAKEHVRVHGRCPTCEMVERQTSTGSLLVTENADFVAIASFASRFPYETWILPKAHAHGFGEASIATIHTLAIILKRILIAMESALGVFPFNLVLQTSPARLDALTARAFHWRLEIIPRLTIPSGFELGSDMFIVSVSPEDAAVKLRSFL
jgi:UDPglucose--hexose-1-phosphate uridylyltransferase